MSEKATCQLCGEPMPEGEGMFKYHGYSGNCPKPPLPKPADPQPASNLVEKAREFYEREVGKPQYPDGGLITFEDMADFCSQQNADLIEKLHKCDGMANEINILTKENADLSRKVREFEAERKHFLEHVFVVRFDGYFEGEIAKVVGVWKAQRECYVKNKHGGSEVEQRKAEFGSFDEAWHWILSHGDRCEAFTALEDKGENL